jgi:hypothetical protein
MFPDDTYHPIHELSSGIDPKRILIHSEPRHWLERIKIATKLKKESHIVLPNPI